MRKCEKKEAGQGRGSELRGLWPSDCVKEASLLFVQHKGHIRRSEQSKDGGHQARDYDPRPHWRDVLAGSEGRRALGLGEKSWPGLEVLDLGRGLQRQWDRPGGAEDCHAEARQGPGGQEAVAAGPKQQHQILPEPSCPPGVREEDIDLFHWLRLLPELRARLLRSDFMRLSLRLVAKHARNARSAVHLLSSAACFFSMEIIVCHRMFNSNPGPRKN